MKKNEQAEQAIEQQEELETRTAEDKAAFLDDIEADFDPEVAIEKQAEADQQKAEQVDAAQMMQAATQETVLAGVGFAEVVLKEFVDDRLEVGEDNAKALANAAAPVVLKYNVSPPPWALKYKEEIGLGLVALSISASLFLQHRGLKKFDRLAALEAQQNAQAESEKTAS